MFGLLVALIRRGARIRVPSRFFLAPPAAPGAVLVSAKGPVSAGFGAANRPNYRLDINHFC